MKKDSTSAALFSLAVSLGLTGALMALIRWLGPRGFEDVAAVVFQRNPSCILALFFGIYCGTMIFYVAIRKRHFPDHFRLLVFYCCFPVAIGLAGSLFGSQLGPSESEPLAFPDSAQNTTFYPFYIGSLASLINLIALIAVYRSKRVKRSKRRFT